MAWEEVWIDMLIHHSYRSTYVSFAVTGTVHFLCTTPTCSTPSKRAWACTLGIWALQLQLCALTGAPCVFSMQNSKWTRNWRPPHCYSREGLMRSTVSWIPVLLIVNYHYTCNHWPLRAMGSWGNERCMHRRRPVLLSNINPISIL